MYYCRVQDINLAKYRHNTALSMLLSGKCSQLEEFISKIVCGIEEFIVSIGKITLLDCRFLSTNMERYPFPAV